MVVERREWDEEEEYDFESEDDILESLPESDEEEYMDEEEESEELDEAEAEYEDGASLYGEKIRDDRVYSRVVSKNDVFASEIMGDRRLLAVFLSIGDKPSGPRELLGNVRFWVPMGEGVVEKRLAESSLHKILGRLVELGLVEASKGIDSRRRIYRLTDTGRSVLRELLVFLKKYVMRRVWWNSRVSRDYPDVVKRELGVDPVLLAGLLNIRLVTEGYVTGYVLEG